MINDPRSEPYYDHLIKMGYSFLDYSEKHYIFERAGRVIKVAKSLYNHEKTDESYEIEKAAHELLRINQVPVAEIYNVYPKGSFLDEFTVLEEEKVNGEIYYKKDCEKNLLSQALQLMQTATRIKGKNFGMMERDGHAAFSSWKEFLYYAVKDMKNGEKELICRKIQALPNIIESAFVFTDCNMANFVFNGNQLVKAIDVERPLWGDPYFLYGVIKRRNPYMYVLIGKEAESEIVDLYAKIYPYIFGGCRDVM